MINRFLKTMNKLALIVKVVLLRKLNRIIKIMHLIFLDRELMANGLVITNKNKIEEIKIHNW